MSMDNAGEFDLPERKHAQCGNGKRNEHDDSEAIVVFLE
jgi:hypothetical protein